MGAPGWSAASGSFLSAILNPAMDKHANQRSNLERLLRTAWDRQQQLQARAAMAEQGAGARQMQSPNDKRARNLSVDGLVGVIALIFLQLVHMNVATMTLLWMILIIACGKFIWDTSFSKKPKILAICACSLSLAIGAYDAIEEKVTNDEVKAEREGARYDIVGAEFADTGKSPDVNWPFANFYYKNGGSAVIQGMARRVSIVIGAADHTFSKHELDEQFKNVEDFPYNMEIQDDIPPGNEGHFSEPHEVGEEQRFVEKAMPDVRSGKSKIYFFIVTKYIDPLMPKDKIRVSEFGAYFDNNLAVAHYVRQNAVHIITRK